MRAKAAALADVRIERLAAAAAIAAGIAYAVLLASPYGVRLLTLGGIYALLVIGYQFIFGHAGALSLAQGSFFGLGAYMTGILGVKAGWGFAATFPLSIAAPTLLALLVAAPVLRLEAHYFALATLGIGQVLLLGALNWESMTGGANGLFGVPPVRVFGGVVPAGLPLLAFVWGILACFAAAAWQATRGPWGRAFLMLREDPRGAAAIGLDGAGLRLAAFLLSAAYAGAAGALYAHTLRIVSPEVLGFPVMVTCLAMAVVGGRTRIAGAVIGALLLVALPEWLRFLQGSYLLAYGLVLLAVIVLAPEGVMGVLGRLRRLLLGDKAEEGSALRPLALPAAAGPAARLELRGLVKRFGGVEAVGGVDLSLEPGEILGLIGPNGSGKTTLINLVSGVERADAGSIRLGGAALDRLPPHRIARHGIARSFQAGSFVAGLTALDAVSLARLAAGGSLTLRRAFAFRRGGREVARAEAEAAHLLIRFGVAEAMHRRLAMLPHGMRRRLEMARALATGPRFLLLDEPAAGLAEEERADLARRLTELARDGLGILVIEHDMAFLMPLAHRIVCLDHGRVLATGSPEAIARDPAVLAAYLGGDVRETPTGPGR